MLHVTDSLDSEVPADAWVSRAICCRTRMPAGAAGNSGGTVLRRHAGSCKADDGFGSKSFLA